MSLTQTVATVEATSQPNQEHKVITKYKIGKKTYIVEASSCEKATETIKSKVEKLILRDCTRMK